MRAGRLGLVLLVGAATLTVPAGVAHADDACTTTFTGAVDQAWEKAGNWSAGVPTSASVACLGSTTEVQVTTGAQQAGELQGSALRITGGSLTVHGSMSLDRWDQDGGAFTSLSDVVVSVAYWTGDSTIDLGGAQSDFQILDIGGTGHTVLTGHPVQFAAAASITNPGFTTDGPTGISDGYQLTVGPGVVVQHSGGAPAVFSTDELSGPSTGTYGFAADTLRLSLPRYAPGPQGFTVPVSKGTRLMAGAIDLPSSSSPRAGVTAMTLTGSGTVDVRSISGAVQPGDADGPDLQLIGPVDLSQATILLPLRSCAPVGQLVVTGGVATLGGHATSLARDSCQPSAGSTLPFITDASGIADGAATMDRTHRFHVSATTTTASLVTNPATSTSAHIIDGDVIRPYDHLTVRVVVSSPSGTPDGGFVSLDECSQGIDPTSFPVFAGSAQFGLAVGFCDYPVTALGAHARTITYLGDDVDGGHAPSSTTLTYTITAPPLAPVLEATPDATSVAVTFAPGVDQPDYDPVTGYELSLAGPSGTLTRTITTAGTTTFDGLAPATTYTVTARATDVLGEGDRSTSTFTTPALPGTPTLTAIGRTGAITATVGAGTAQRWVVQARPVDSWLGPTVTAIDAHPGVPVTLSQLVPGEAYTVTVTAWDALGRSTTSAPVIRVASTGTTVSLLRTRHGLLGYASRGGVPVPRAAVRLLEGSTVLKRLTTDGTGRFTVATSTRTHGLVRASAVIDHRTTRSGRISL